MALKIGSMYKIKRRVPASSLEEERDASGWHILYPDDNFVFVLLEKEQILDTEYESIYGSHPLESPEMMRYKFLRSDGSIYYVRKQNNTRYYFEKTRFEEIC